VREERRNWGGFRVTYSEISPSGLPNCLLHNPCVEGILRPCNPEDENLRLHYLLYRCDHAQIRKVLCLALSQKT
ncbi:hypothetical protein U1Q18_001911, partial [Sarracenia purpurea var. burkii]